MTIYILDQDPKLCAQYLDDGALNNMIKDVAQVLCNVHWVIDLNKSKEDIIKLMFRYKDGIPLKHKKISGFDEWTRECHANYLWMVGLLDSLLYEQRYRFDTQCDKQKYWKISILARDNVPELPHKDCDFHLYNDPECALAHGGLPLVMPEKYLIVGYLNEATGKIRFADIEETIIDSYRNYYQAKVKSDAKWSRRERPEFLD